VTSSMATLGCLRARRGYRLDSIRAELKLRHRWCDVGGSIASNCRRKISLAYFILYVNYDFIFNIGGTARSGGETHTLRTQSTVA
jgi:hypothetical protein